MFDIKWRHTKFQWVQCLKKGIVIIGTFFLLLSSLVSCGVNRSSDAPDIYIDDEQTKAIKASQPILKLVMPQKQYHLNPYEQHDEADTLLMHQLYEGLTTYNSKGKVTQLSTSEIQHDDDYLTWIFTLRDDLKWSDHSPVTADDFKRSWLKTMRSDQIDRARLCVIKGGLVYAQTGEYEDLVGIRAEGNRLIVELTHPMDHFDEWVTHPAFLPERTAEDGTPLYNGPYQLDALNQGEIKLSVNQAYWDAVNIQFKEVQIELKADDVAAFEQFNRGDVDLFGEPFYNVPYQRRSRLKSDPHVLQFPTQRIDYIAFPSMRSFYQSAEVRRQLERVLDFDFLRTAVLYDTSLNVLEHKKPTSEDIKAGKKQLEMILDQLDAKKQLDDILCVSSDELLDYRLVVNFVKEWVKLLPFRTNLKTLSKAPVDRPIDVWYGQVNTNTLHDMDFIRILALEQTLLKTHESSKEKNISAVDLTSGQTDEIAHLIAQLNTSIQLGEMTLDDILTMDDGALMEWVQTAWPIIPTLKRTSALFVGDRIEGAAVLPNGLLLLKNLTIRTPSHS